MNEIGESETFIQKIDCNFPYDHFLDGKKLIDEALQISPESVFAIIQELVRIPKNSIVSKKKISFYLKYITHSFEHPLKTLILDFANLYHKTGKVSFEEIEFAMKKIIEFKGSYMALNILYFLGSHDDRIDHIYDEIVSQWES